MRACRRARSDAAHRRQGAPRGRLELHLHTPPEGHGSSACPPACGALQDVKDEEGAAQQGQEEPDYETAAEELPEVRCHFSPGLLRAPSCLLRMEQPGHAPPPPANLTSLRGLRRRSAALCTDSAESAVTGRAALLLDVCDEPQDAMAATSSSPDSDFQRGARYKRLLKLLRSPMVSARPPRTAPHAAHAHAPRRATATGCD